MTALDIEKERDAYEAAIPASWSRARIADDEGEMVYIDDLVQGGFIGWISAKRITQPAPADFETFVRTKYGPALLAKNENGGYAYSLTRDRLECWRAAQRAATVPAQAGDQVRVTLESAAGYLNEYIKLLYEVKPADIEAHPYPPAVEQVAEELRTIAAAQAGMPASGDGLTDTLREASNFIAGFFAHEEMPANVKELVRKLRTVTAAGQGGEDAR